MSGSPIPKAAHGSDFDDDPISIFAKFVCLKSQNCIQHLLVRDKACLFITKCMQHKCFLEKEQWVDMHSVYLCQLS